MRERESERERERERILSVSHWTQIAVGYRILGVSSIPVSKYIVAGVDGHVRL